MKMENMDYNCDYHAFKIADRASSRINGGTATAIALGSAALVGVVGAWFAAQTRARGAENLIASQQSSNQNFINYIANQQSIDHADRMAFQNYSISRACPQPVTLYSMQSCCPCPQPCNGCNQ